MVGGGHEPGDPPTAPDPEASPVAPDPKALRPDTPHVWLFDTSSPGFDALADRGPVADEERARADRLRAEGAGRLLLARRAALRRVLALYRECAPGEVRVVTAPGGKPVLSPHAVKAVHSPRPLSFSIAHSGDRFAVAVDSMASVGVDVDLIREVPWARSIAKKWFGAAEAASLDRLDGSALEMAFLRLWTAKEALAKRHGAGLRLMRESGTELDVEAALAKERLVHLDSGADHVGALASSEPIRTLVTAPDALGRINDV